MFDDWFAGGPEADDFWRDYERQRGSTYYEAIRGYNAVHIFEYDRYHLDRSDGAILVMPCGRSGHLELGYIAGQCKPGWVLFDGEPERWDVMYQFATGGVHFKVESLLKSVSDTFGLK